MNTTTNTRVSEAMVERAASAFMRVRGLGMPRPWEGMLESSRELYRPAFRAALEAALSAEPAAQGEEVVDRVAKAIADAAGHGMREKCEHMAHAAIAAYQLATWNTAPPAQPAERACYCACASGGPCEHKFDGKSYESDGLWTKTCSRCGLTAFSHSMRNCP